MKLTIATGIYHPETGGPATFLQDFVPLLKKSGWDINIVTYGAKRPGVIAVSRKTPFRWFFFCIAVLKSARTSDLILTTDPFSSGFPAAVAATLLRKKMVLRFVGDPSWEISRSVGWTSDPFEKFQQHTYGLKIETIRRIQKWVLKKSSIFTVSLYLQGLLKKWGFQSTVIYNAIHPISLPEKNTLRKKFGFQDRFVLVNVGRVTTYKGIDKIILLCASLKKKIPNLLLVVVGDGPDLEEMKSLVKREQLVDVVHFVGRQDAAATRAYMKSADGLILNSEYEGMSHTLLEAMSVECPVIASAVCGNPELVKNRGFLFECGNMDQLKDCILSVYTNPKKARKMAIHARTVPTKKDQDKQLLSFFNNIV